MKFSSPISAFYSFLSVSNCTFQPHSNGYSFTLVDPSIPIQFMRNAEYQDMLMGVIHSEMIHFVQPKGKPLKIFQSDLSELTKLAFAQCLDEIPAFVRQKEILADIGVDLNANKPLNKCVIGDTVAGKKVKMRSMFDIINLEETFRRLYTYQSFERNLMNGDKLYYRPGFYSEHYGSGKHKRSYHNIPVLSDDSHILSSPFTPYPKGPYINKRSKEILTIVFGIGLSIEELNCFVEALLALAKRQEKEAGTRTISSGIVSGYPGFYQLNKPKDLQLYAQLTPNVVGDDLNPPFYSC